MSVAETSLRDDENLQWGVPEPMILRHLGPFGLRMRVPLGDLEAIGPALKRALERRGAVILVHGWVPDLDTYVLRVGEAKVVVVGEWLEGLTLAGRSPLVNEIIAEVGAALGRRKGPPWTEHKRVQLVRRFNADASRALRAAIAQLATEYHTEHPFIFKGARLQTVRGTVGGHAFCYQEQPKSGIRVIGDSEHIDEIAEALRAAAGLLKL